MTPRRTPEGKVVLYLTSTGQRFERWPVDAGAMLATGAYTADTPNEADSGSVPASVAPGGDGAAAPYFPPPVLSTEASPAAPVRLPVAGQRRGKNA